MFRSATVESVRAEADKPAKVRMSISSEEPVVTWAWFNDQYQRVWEILDHSPASVNLSRCKDGLVVLDRHYGDQVGLMDIKNENRKLGGDVEFCSGSRAKDIAEDAARGLRRNVSVGYRVDAASYRIEGTKDGIPVVRAMSWMPYEASFEPVPADTTVGVNRGACNDASKPSAQCAHEASNTNNNATRQESKTMDPKTMAEMFTRAAECGIDAAQVRDLIAAGKGMAELNAMIVDKQRVEIKDLRTRKPSAADANGGVTPPSPLGGSANAEQKIVRRYSLHRVMRFLAGDSSQDIGFEREISQEVRRMGGTTGRGVITVPFAALSTRATSLSESGTSSATVGTELMAGEFIDVVRPYSILPELGVRFMSGLVGNVAIPKKTVAGSGYWVAEEADITRLAPTLSQITLQPKTCGAACDISHLLSMQSTPSAEQLVRDDIAASVATKIESGVFATGGAGSVTPITSATGINNPTVTAGTPTYAQILDFPASILADGGSKNNWRFAMSAATWAKLSATYNDGTTKSYPVLDNGAQRCIGHPYSISENVGTNALFFGDWSTVIVGTWGGGIDFVVDTSTLSLAGGTRIVGLLMVDVAVRRGQDLAYNTAVAA
jgi:HK97 family phage major capsid protein